MLKALFKIINPSDRKTFYIVLFISLINSISELVGVSAVIPFLLLLLSPDKLIHSPYYQKYVGHILPNVSYNELIYISSALLTAAILLKGLFYLWSQYVSSKFVATVCANIRKQLYCIYLSQGYLFYLKQSTGTLINNLNAEINNFEGNYMRSIIMLTTNGLILIFILGFLLWFSPVATILSITCFSMGILFLHFVLLKHLDKQGKIREASLNKINHLTMQGLGSIKETKLMHRENHYKKVFSTTTNELLKSSMFAILGTLLPRPVIETIIMLSVIFTMLVMIYLKVEPHHIVLVISLFAISSMRLIPAVNAMISSFASIKYAKSSVKLIYNELQLSQHSPAIDRTPLPELKTLSLVNVNFTYPASDSPVLKRLSCEIKEGQSIGFVGPSGAGKSTLIDLLLGLIPPDSGHLKLNGKQFNPTNNESWQTRLGYIPQAIYLANDSIRNNIALGLPEDKIDDARIWEALELAQLSEFIKSMPDQLDSQIGEGGLRISGGQRQRVGIARALYNKPQILVMDEATSALDNETEKAFIASLQKLHGKITMIIIAHRLKTIEKCDKIFVLDKGELKASGTYSELLRSSQEFGKLAAIEPNAS